MYHTYAHPRVTSPAPRPRRELISVNLLPTTLRRATRPYPMQERGAGEGAAEQQGVMSIIGSSGPFARLDPHHTTTSSAVGGREGGVEKSGVAGSSGALLLQACV